MRTKLFSFPSLYNFYPRPPRGGRHHRQRQHERGGRISTHALREEGDLKAAPLVFSWFSFLPTPSARRATVTYQTTYNNFLFLPTPSARRATSARASSTFSAAFLPTPSARRATHTSTYTRATASDFYPRPPRGGRLAIRSPSNF